MPPQESLARQLHSSSRHPPRRPPSPEPRRTTMNGSSPSSRRRCAHLILQRLARVAIYPWAAARGSRPSLQWCGAPASRCRCRTTIWEVAFAGSADGSAEDYSAAATVVRFDPLLPLLRAPVSSPASSGDGPVVLAFRDAASWRAAWGFAEASLVSQ